MKKSALLCTLVLSSLATAPFVQAEEFLLDKVVVTATRSEKQEMDIPMSSTTITAEELTHAGFSNVQTALSDTLGIAYKQTGPGGGHMGVMNSEIAIRGVANGTLVMVNGNPINSRGKYFLDAIPAERIERIEIIKGGGSVLYGSEAMGGVINIITKKAGTRSLSVGLGNYGQQNFDAQIGNETFSLALHRERWGAVKNINLIDDYRSADAP